MKKLLVVFLFAVISLPVMAENEAVMAAMQDIQFLEGQWEGTTWTYNFETQEWVDPQPAGNTITGILGGAMLEDNAFTTFSGEHFKLKTIFAYDHLREIYRLAVADDANGYLDFYTGMFSDGQLLVDNLTTGTPWVSKDSGQEYHFQLIWKLSEEGHLDFLVNITADAGENWSPYVKTQVKKAD